MQRDTAIFEVLGAGDFGTTETTGDGHLDAFGLCAHGGGDGGLDSLLVGHAALDLAGDVLRDELGVEVRTFHFVDVDLDFLSGDDLEFFLHAVNFSTAFADDHAGTSSVDGHRDELESSFNVDFRNAGF